MRKGIDALQAALRRTRLPIASLIAQQTFLHTCDLWKVVRGVATDAVGTPPDDVYVLVYSGVACTYHYTPNVDDPTELGRFKRATLFTTDHVDFPIGQKVGNGWWIVNRTPGPNYGQVAKLLGAAQQLTNNLTNLADKQALQTMSEENPPAEILEAL